MQVCFPRPKLHCSGSLSKPTSGIGLTTGCCFNFGYFVYNPIIETVEDHRAGWKEGRAQTKLKPKFEGILMF